MVRFRAFGSESPAGRAARIRRGDPGMFRLRARGMGAKPEQHGAPSDRGICHHAIYVPGKRAEEVFGAAAGTDG
ncbi:hypothetical protein AWN90_05330 [Nocardia terpenica]|uniref:Uncharacterized protein n=1 Tax=Nocardia terpenica TaxID=455432 RepID=A0A164J3Q1_9NOCA|nr:hypothetical protein AWN90_05330 [Nocardia terpenica]